MTISVGVFGVDYEERRLAAEIERLRNVLSNQCEAGDLVSPEILSLSQRLDRLINSYYRLMDPASAAV